MVFFAKKQAIHKPPDDKKELEKTIRSITNSGKSEIDPELLMQVRELCRKSNENIEFSCSIIMKGLRKKHSESRYSAMHLCNELFKRSSVFRQNFVPKFREFVDLTTGIDKQNPLPPPQTVAERLKRDSIELIYKWAKQYGSTYPAIQLSYDYLSNFGKVNFTEVEEKLKLEYHKKEEKRTKAENLKRERLRKVKAEMEESVGEVKDTLSQIQACFTLLVPTFDEDVSSQQLDDFSIDTVREHGIVQSGYSVSVELPDCKTIFEKNEDNAAVIENLQDLYALLNNKYWPVVERWRLTLQQCGGDVTPAIKLKSDIDDVLVRYKEFGIQLKERNANVVENSSDDDSDFEEVEEKEGYEAEAVSTPVNAPGSSGVRFGAVSSSAGPQNEPQPSTSKQVFSKDSSNKLTSSAKAHHSSEIETSDSEDERQPSRSQVPDWQDPELLRQLEEKTGINLKMPEPRKKKQKRRKKPKAKKTSLTSLKALKDTPRNRLHKKIFKKSTLKRVANSLDAGGRVLL